MSVPVLYLAHPVGAPTEVGVQVNLARARTWLGLLIAECPDVSWCVSWLPYLDVLRDNTENRIRGLRDDCAVAERCDAVVMVGDVIGGSAGMRREAAVARETIDATGRDVAAVAEIVNAWVASRGKP